MESFLQQTHKLEVFPSSHGTSTFFSSHDILWCSDKTGLASAFVTLYVPNGRSVGSSSMGTGATFTAADEACNSWV